MANDSGGDAKPLAVSGGMIKRLLRNYDCNLEWNKLYGTATN